MNARKVSPNDNGEESASEAGGPRPDDSPDDVQADIVEGADNSESKKEVPEISESELRLARLRSLLPPKFLVADPDFNSTDGDSVLIPDGKGGVSSVKRNVVKVQHKGQTIELVALSPERRRRRQMFWNCVWIIAGVLFFWLVFSMI